MIYGWHFLCDDGTAAGGYVPPSDGSMEKIEPPIVLCERGFHASKRPIDALRYANGALIRRVVMSGEIIEDDDKVVATQRRELWRADATIAMHRFAVWCANEALIKERRAGREPDIRSWAALQAKLDWLDGKITDEELDAAGTAAWAARAACDAWDAAARAAAWAARAAAWAARAAWDAAARDAAWAAAWDAAAGTAQNKKLHKMLLGLKP
jgi:hypothetical protein